MSVENTKKAWMIRACLRKKVYHKLSDAQHAAEHMNSRKHKDYMMGYKCQVCGEAHIAHRIPRAVRLDG